MSYKRRNPFNSRYSGPTKATIFWSQKSSAYAFKFHDTNHWNEMQIFITYMKTIPYGERDYDPVEKTWYFVEKYLPQVKAMFDTLKGANIFELDFQEKPIGQPTAQFVPVDVYLDRFKDIAGETVKDIDYSTAKKIYRRACMRLHPDRGGDPAVMSTLNQTWTELENVYFKIKKEVEYEQVSSVT